MSADTNAIQGADPPAGRPVSPGTAAFAEITPITVTRLADSVADQIRGLIVSENVEEGTRLPSERDLAERFGASRPTVSQALRTLAVMGLVEIRRGSGAYVLRRPETMVTASVNLMLDLDGDGQSLDHLMQLRLWLETIGVTHATTREPPLEQAEVDTLLAALERLRAAAGHPSEWIADDTVFHAAGVRSAGNPYLVAIYESVHTAIVSKQLQQWVEAEEIPSWLGDTTPEDQLSLHEPIARAVIDRDPEAARQAVLVHHQVMYEHLMQSQRAARERAARRR